MSSIEMPNNKQPEPDQALRELYERLGPAVLSRCFYLLRDQAEAEDALQEVFARVSHHLALFQSDSSPLTALTQLATRHCLNVIRGSKAGWRGEQHRIASLRPALESGTLEGPELVRALLATVDLETQAAAVHFYVDELSLEELSSALGRQVPELRKRLAAFAATARNQGKPARSGAPSTAEEDSLAIPGTREEGCSWRDLRRFRAGELPRDEAVRVETLLSGCGRCQAADAALQAEVEALRRSADFSHVADTILRKHTYQQRRRWAGPVSLLLAVGMTTLVMWSPVRQLACGNSRGAPTRQSDAALELHGTSDDASATPRLVHDGDRLAPGERVRVSYRASGDGYLVVLSIDESGEVLQLHPTSGEHGGPALPGAEQPVGEVAPAGQARRILALFSEEPLRIADAIEAARLELKRAGSIDTMGPLRLSAKQSSRVLRHP